MTDTTPGISALRRIYLGRESTAGTAVVATTPWRGKGTIEDQREVKFAEENVALISGADRTYIAKLLAELVMDDVEATYEQLPHILEAGIKTVTAAADGSGSSGYLYTYTFPTTAKNTLKNYTLEGGDDRDKEEVEYGFVKNFKLSGKAAEAWMMGATWKGRQVTRGPVVTGTGIAFVASTKKITDSNSGLAVFLTGTTIKVTGTVSNDGVYTVATGGVAGEIVVTEALTDESAGSSFTVQDWFSGGPTGLALPSVEEILFGNSLLYIDDADGTIGTTLVSNTLLGAEFGGPTGWEEVFGDGALYFNFAKQTGVPPNGSLEPMLNVTFEHDGNSVAEKVNWRDEVARLIRIDVPGSALGTAGSGTTFSGYKGLRIDLAGKWESFTKLDEQDGNDIVNGVFRARYNSTAALFAEIKVVNELSSLP